MSKLLSLGAAAIACAAVFGAATPTAAKDYEYCRRDVSSYMLSCGFETLAQCQDMSSGRGCECIRNPSLGGAADAFAYAPIVRKNRQK
jgi:Protein of unknown function (DUF3551)